MTVEQDLAHLRGLPRQIDMCHTVYPYANPCAITAVSSRGGGGGLFEEGCVDGTYSTFDAILFGLLVFPTDDETGTRCVA